MRDILKRFWHDERGIAFVFFLVAMPAFIGVSLLAIDIGRGNNLHYDVQKGVDALALAAAAELDGTTGARQRSADALEDKVGNQTRFSDNGTLILDPEDVDWAFLKSIPNNDDEEIDLDVHEAADDFEAQFIWVWVSGEDRQPYTTIFPVSLALGSQTVEIGADAVAGFTRNVCDFTPIFMCNPFEQDTNVDIRSEPPNSDVWRRLIKLKAQGQSSEYFPGNFGWIESPGGPGKNELGESIARATVDACYTRRGVTTEPGQMVSLHEDVNVRFDMYPQGNPGNTRKSDPDYRPALNVRKGMKPHQSGDWCRPQEPDDTENPAEKLLRDTCFETGEPGFCESGVAEGRVGDGEWDFEAYWATNYPGEERPDDEDGIEWSNSNLPTRYEVYRYELDNYHLVQTAAGDFDEIGAPVCADTAQEDDIDRRVFYGAIINCLEHAPLSGREVDVPVLAFGRFFLTEPATRPSDAAIWAELAGLVDPGDARPAIRDEAVLYR